MSTVTLTFAEAGENGIGQEIIGTKSTSGYSLSDLEAVAAMFPDKATIYDLRNLCPQFYSSLDEAYILIVKNPFTIADEVYIRMINPESRWGVDWDKKKYMRNGVKNLHARYNLLFDNLGNINTGVPEYIRQKATMSNIVVDSHGNIIKRLPNYEEKEGTIYNWNYFPEMRELIHQISQFPNTSNPIIEGNYYFDVKSTYIGMHGDTERMKVIGYRLGHDLPLHYQWFHRSQPISQRFSFTLSHGDLYMMSEKAVGTDWKSSSKFTLRHGAGFSEVLAKHEK